MEEWQDDNIEPEESEEMPEIAEDDDDYPPHKPEYPSFWQMLRRFFYQTRAEKNAERNRRLADLNRAILSEPDAAANYMLRGEIRLEQKDYELAHDDFVQAITLAQAQFENDRWGFAAQTIMDRAQEGLRQTLRYLG